MWRKVHSLTAGTWQYHRTRSPLPRIEHNLGRPQGDRRGSRRAAGREGRWSAMRKTTAVLRLLRGEDLETLSRELDSCCLGCGRNPKSRPSEISKASGSPVSRLARAKKSGQIILAEAVGCVDARHAPTARSNAQHNS